jgi:outer membrane scaffolding protein for murein synthesis (MipA/OmpV family)
VLAWRIAGRATQDAPVGAYSSVGLRGYVPGNYLAPHSLSLEAEERYRLNDRWGLAAFGGAACLLEDVSDCGDADNWYPAVGAGVIYTLKPKEKLVVRLDYAVGEGDNSGLYLSFGQPF